MKLIFASFFFPKGSYVVSTLSLRAPPYLPPDLQPFLVPKPSSATLQASLVRVRLWRGGDLYLPPFPSTSRHGFSVPFMVGGAEAPYPL